MRCAECGRERMHEHAMSPQDEFKKLLSRYGNASEYVGELGADPDCRITRLHKAEDEQERLWNEILEALDELVKEES